MEGGKGERGRAKTMYGNRERFVCRDGRMGRWTGGQQFDGADLVCPARCLAPDSIGSLDDVGEGRAALPDDRSHTRVLLVVLGLELCVLERAGEGNIGVLGVAAHEAEGLCGGERGKKRKRWVERLDLSHSLPLSHARSRALSHSGPLSLFGALKVRVDS